MLSIEPSCADHCRMKLQRARLCLDCEELHEEQQCPVCASEVFAFVTRWVPARENRPPPTPRPPAGLTNTQKAVGIGVGLGVMGLARWFATGRKLIEDAATRRDVGELK
jgi:hypothetical protein